jgi:hypothetical protein
MAIPLLGSPFGLLYRRHVFAILRVTVAFLLSTSTILKQITFNENPIDVKPFSARSGPWF